MYLTIEGYLVESASDGEEAMRALSTFRPDLVILDVMMPGMDGLEACRRLKADPMTRDVPVVMFTALTRDEDVASGRAAGADRFIHKPFSLIGLGAVIRDFLGGGLPAAV